LIGKKRSDSRGGYGDYFFVLFQVFHEMTGVVYEYSCLVGAGVNTVSAADTDVVIYL
jgi:hypothetical protein